MNLRRAQVPQEILEEVKAFDEKSSEMLNLNLELI